VADLWWALTRGLARFAVFSYYRSFRLEHGERIPRDGPVLFVLNHPNSLLDPAALMLASPRPVHFAAKGPLFRLPVLGSILRRIGAVPIDRPQDSGSDVRRNVTSAFGRMVEILRGGGSCAIFPEGISHTDPELKTVKSGPARIALEAEEASGWAMGLLVVPVGLTFHPRQVFRGDVVVRVGESFRVDDLKAENRHKAIRIVQERIAEALKPLIHRVDRLELAPLVEAIADLYGEDRKWTGRSGQPLPREEVVRAAETCLNHNLVADPEAVAEVGRRLRQLERLSGRAGVPLESARIRGSPVRAFLAFAGRGLLLVLGFPVYVWGLLTGFVPYRATDRFARALAAKSGGPTALPLSRVILGILCFGLWWGGLTFIYWRWSSSALLATIFAVSLAVGGLLARSYWLRAQALLEGLEALLPFFARRRALARVAEARSELLALVEDLARRTEAALGQPLVPPGARPKRLFPWGKVAAVVLAGAVTWFLVGLHGEEFRELAGAPSPWKDLPAEEARAALDRDARVLASHLDTLQGLSDRMGAIRADIDGGRRTFYDPETDREIRGAMLSYLTCREGLLKIAWFYKEPARPERDLEVRASLAAYGAAVELVARGMQLVDAFHGHPDAVRKLNEADFRAEIPAGTYDRVRRNLADSDLLDALAEAEARFRRDRETGPIPAEEPWARIAARAEGGSKVVSDLSDRLWTYKWENAVTRALKTGGEGRYRASSVVSTWIGDARVRTRRDGGGLVSKEQVDAFRARLRPGDILVERRNWYLSNAFLPGFWKHAAIYLGGTDGVRSLGLAADPGIGRAVDLLGRPDHDGHRREVIEAISEGVLLTSLEESIGGADAVCAFRPRVPPEAVSAAVRRALLQQGKPYDFDFDFFSTDRLVCTEVVYQAYQESVHFELVEIMGRRTLPALEIVKLWANGRGKAEASLQFVAFLDGDEAAGTAREADEETLVASIGRPSLTPLQAGARGRPLLLSPWFAAMVVMTLAGIVVFRKRPAPGPL
jgi:1-acyl-sn-glycerol-3-phosphate acyltransferase